MYMYTYVYIHVYAYILWDEYIYIILHISLGWSHFSRIGNVVVIVQ